MIIKDSLFTELNILTDEKFRSLLKWAREKKQLLKKLESRMTKKTGRYFEPFIGGGALKCDVDDIMEFIDDEKVAEE